MRILFLTHYFPPEVNAPASRTFEHCRAWARAGHEVTVLTCAPNHPNGQVYPGYRNALWTTERVDGIRVVRLWTWLAANEGFLRRTLNYVSFLAAAVAAAPFVPAADVVISTSPQFFCGLAGFALGRAKRAPWVLEVRDLWPESILAVGAIRSPAVIRFLEGLESWAYRKAHRIVSVTESVRRPHAGARHPRGEDRRRQERRRPLDLQPPRQGPMLARELGLEGRFVAAYFGTHGMAHRLETVLEAAKLLEHDPRIAFLLAGGGAERARLLARKEEMGLANVVMLDQQPKARMPALWGLSDVSLVLLKRTDLFKTVIPSKIFEAMAMERPIVLGVEGESRGIVEGAGCGIAIEPDNAAELASAVTRLADDPALARAMGERGRRHVTTHFDRDVLAARFERLLADLAGPAAAAAPRHAEPA